MKTKAIDMQKLAEHLKKREQEYRRMADLCNHNTGQGQYYAILNGGAADEIKFIVEILRKAYKQKGPLGRYVIEYEKEKK